MVNFKTCFLYYFHLSQPTMLVYQKNKWDLQHFTEPVAADKSFFDNWYLIFHPEWLSKWEDLHTTKRKQHHLFAWLAQLVQLWGRRQPKSLMWCHTPKCTCPCSGVPTQQLFWLQAWPVSIPAIVLSSSHSFKITHQKKTCTYHATGWSKPPVSPDLFPFNSGQISPPNKSHPSPATSIAPICISASSCGL